jgi:hypothetical protein
MKNSLPNSKEIPAGQFPRRVARNSKIRAMVPRQIKSLRRWLLSEKITYDQARRRLLNRFGISLSVVTICRFWYTFCQPAKSPRRETPSNVFLDVVLQSTKPIRVRILETRARLRFKIGTQRQRGLNKKPTFTINPTGAVTSKT